MLKASARGTIAPEETGIAATYRQAVITDLVDQGLIAVVAQKIKEVYLTEEGKQFLCQEYSSRSRAKEISLKMLSGYLQLMHTNISPDYPKHEKKISSRVSGKKPLTLKF